MLAVTGPQQYEAVVAAVHDAAPPVPSPFIDLVPEAGLKLTPRHYSYIKISEGCNHRCAFCIIPSIRGDLVSRRPDAILREAEKLVAAGTRELLVISQDTSAYGVDLRHAAWPWKGGPDGEAGSVRAHMTDLARELGSLGAWVRLHYVYPYPHVDHIIPLMAEGLVLPYLDIPFQHASPKILRAMRRPPNAPCAPADREWREVSPDIAIRSSFVVGFPEIPTKIPVPASTAREAQLDRVGAFRFDPLKPPPPMRSRRRAGRGSSTSASDASGSFFRPESAPPSSRPRSADARRADRPPSTPDKPAARPAAAQADAPEIDGEVTSRRGGLKAGDIVAVRVEDSASTIFSAFTWSWRSPKARA